MEEKKKVKKVLTDVINNCCCETVCGEKIEDGNGGFVVPINSVFTMTLDAYGDYGKIKRLSADGKKTAGGAVAIKNSFPRYAVVNNGKGLSVINLDDGMFTFLGHLLDIIKNEKI